MSLQCVGHIISYNTCDNYCYPIFQISKSEWSCDLSQSINL